MSPTEAMLTRSDDLAGRGGGAGVSGSGVASIGLSDGSTVSSSAGVVAQAASCSTAITAASRQVLTNALVTQTNPENVDLGGTQATAQHVQFVKIIGRANVHAVIILIIDLYALNVRLDAM